MPSQQFRRDCFARVFLLSRVELRYYTSNLLNYFNIPLTIILGPLVVPDDDSVADEHPSTEKLSAMLDGSDVYVEEIITERIEEIIRDEIAEFTDDVAVEDVGQLDQIGKS